MTYAAEYTNGSTSKCATLTINRIVNGRREFVEQYPVDGKRYARKLASDLGATPWNF